MNLYNLRSTELGFRINKFDMDANFLASYEVSDDAKTCTCPASLRPSCKHRKMLNRMRSHSDDGWFLCWETQKWHRPMDEDAEVRGEAEGLTIAYSKDLPDDANVAEEFAKLLHPEAEGEAEGSTDLPDGITVIGLDDPEIVHNVIADAVGEAPILHRPLVTRR